MTLQHHAGEDECAVPFAAFRAHAAFVPELTDFGLDSRSFKRILAEQGIEPVGGLGLGDVDILFNTTARHSHIDYEGLCKIVRLLRRRAKALEATHSLPSWNSTRPSSPGRSGTFGGASFGGSPDHTQRAAGGSATSEYAAAGPHSAGGGDLPPRPGSVRGASLLRMSAAQSAAAETLRMGTAELSLLVDPPSIIRETIPTPACSYSGVKSVMKGVQVMYQDGELTRARLSLREVEELWMMALLEDQAKKEKKAGAKKLAAAAAGGAEPPPPPPPKIPLEGRVWLALMGACVSLSLANFAECGERLAAAGELLSDKTLTLAHPYQYCLPLCWGLLAYYTKDYDAAVSQFELGQLKADHVAQLKADLTAAVHHAICINNKGVCLQMSGRRAEAVAAYRQAIERLRTTTGHESPVSQVAMKNLSRAMRMGGVSSARPGSAPTYSTRSQLRSANGGGGGGGGMLGVSALSAGGAPPSLSGAASMLGGGLTAAAAGGAPAHVPAGLASTGTFGAAHPRLVSFLAANISNKPPPVAIPSWAVKIPAGAKVAKAPAGKAPAGSGSGKPPAGRASSGGKGGDKGGGRKPLFDAMITYDQPFFGAQNVAVGKGKKSGGPASAKKKK